MVLIPKYNIPQYKTTGSITQSQQTNPYIFPGTVPI